MDPAGPAHEESCFFKLYNGEQAGGLLGGRWCFLHSVPPLVKLYNILKNWMHNNILKRTLKSCSLQQGIKSTSAPENQGDLLGDPQVRFIEDAKRTFQYVT